MRITAEPRSDQWNGDDFVGGPRTFTIAGVKPGKAEQKYDIELVEGEGRVWRPPPTVVRILIAAWGEESDVWVGRRVTLKFDPTIQFGPDRVGGIRISHLSHIGQMMKLASTVKRGKKTPVTIEPLQEAPQPNIAPHLDAIDTAATMDALGAAWAAINEAGLGKHPELWAAKEARKKELEPKPAGSD